MDVIYLDNNATTKVAPEVVETMLPYLSEYYGNPSSMHSFGGNVGQEIKEARSSIANLIGASPEILVRLTDGKIEFAPSPVPGPGVRHLRRIGHWKRT